MIARRIRRAGCAAALGLGWTLACGLGGAWAAPALEHRPIAGAWPQPLEPIGPTTPAEMEAFVDGFMAAQPAGSFAGAAVAVVKDGALFFSKGYGFADVDKQVPVDPAKTLFRMASVSKVFTWTAIMQLVEQGKLDLDADVNTYLKDMSVPATFSAPITLRNVLTHTAGLEDGFLGYALAPTVERDNLSLRDFLTQHRVTRVRPPTTDFSDGTNASYSNWATDLAGHIVESASGMTFDDYIREHIFKPLGMTSSTFNEPLPADLAARLSLGYEIEAGKFAPQSFELSHNFAPAGSMTSSATDMAKFMLAHLQGGAVDGGRILELKTEALMQTRTMSPDPSLNGALLGFYETWINGRRLVGHAGDLIHFHTILSLLPEAHLGLFVETNTGSALVTYGLERAFFEHYFPARLPAVKPPADAAQRNQRFAGTYRWMRRSDTKAEKVMAVFKDIKVVAMPDGTLYTGPTPISAGQRWVEVGDGVFREKYRDNFMAFKGNAAGHATGLVGLLDPAIATQYVRWYETGPVHGFVMLVSAVLFVVMLVSAIRRRTDRTGDPVLRWARPALAVGGLLLLLFPVALGVGLSGGVDVLAVRIPAGLYVALTLPLLALPAIAAGIYFTSRVWRTGAWTLGSRVQYTLTVLAALLMVLILDYWNLLGYHFG